MFILVFRIWLIGSRQNPLVQTSRTERCGHLLAWCALKNKPPNLRYGENLSSRVNGKVCINQSVCAAPLVFKQRNPNSITSHRYSTITHSSIGLLTAGDFHCGSSRCLWIFSALFRWSAPALYSHNEYTYKRLGAARRDEQIFNDQSFAVLFCLVCSLRIIYGHYYLSNRQSPIKSACWRNCCVCKALWTVHNRRWMGNCDRLAGER